MIISMYLRTVQRASNLTKDALNTFFLNQICCITTELGGRNMLAVMEGDPHRYLYKILLQRKRKHCNYYLVGYSTL